MILHKSLCGEKDGKDTKKSLVLCVKLLMLIVYGLLNCHFYSISCLFHQLLPEMVKVVFLTDREIILGGLGLKSLQLYIDGKMSTSDEAILFPVL